jgi:hypothetical protein
VLEALFLQEKNLWISKEGSMDFGPESSNRMVEEWMERMDADEDDGGEEGGQEGWREDDREVRRAEGGDWAVNAICQCACCYIGRRIALRP